MDVIRDAEGMSACAGCVFVPTMGALHQGHAALIARAREVAHQVGLMRKVAVSIFVNPAQFNERADYDRYPRPLEADLAVCEACGVDVVFAPREGEVFPGGAARYLPAESGLPEVGRLPQLEDRYRPGHMAGVYGVVKRLFDLTRCSGAVFGEKDWQQLQLVRELVKREGLRVSVIAQATVREADGLAMSSRNAMLDGATRARAGGIIAAIRAAQMQLSVAGAEAAARDALSDAGVEVEYAVVRDARTLGKFVEGSAGRVLIAGRVGAVRLIDNDAWPV